MTITFEIVQLKIKIDNLTNNMIKQNSFNITPTVPQMSHMPKSANANFANVNSANANANINSANTNANANAKTSSNAEKPSSSWTSIAENDAHKGNASKGWNVINHVKTTQPKLNKKSNQLVIILHESIENFNSYEMQNKINSALKNVKTNVQITAIAKSISDKNIVMTTAIQNNTDELLSHKMHWEHILNLKYIVKDGEHHQVMTHYININRYKDNMNMFFFIFICLFIKGMEPKVMKLFD